MREHLVLRFRQPDGGARDDAAAGILDYAGDRAEPGLSQTRDKPAENNMQKSKNVNTRDHDIGSYSITTKSNKFDPQYFRLFIESFTV